MAIDLALSGLVLIAVAWLWQLIYSWKKGKEIKKSFLIIYSIGVLLLVIDGYSNGDNNPATLNLLTLILAVLVLLTSSFRKSNVPKLALKKKKR